MNLTYFGPYQAIQSSKKTNEVTNNGQNTVTDASQINSNELTASKSDLISSEKPKNGKTEIANGFI